MLIRLVFLRFALLIISCPFFREPLAAQAVREQVIKGTIVEALSDHPIEGCTLAVVGFPERTTLSSKTGSFMIHRVPMGRQTLLITSAGYETVTIADIDVTSGKEVVLLIHLTERVVAMAELVIKGASGRSVGNPLVAVSAVRFQPEQTSRYAGSLGDPSRMVAGFAGVSSANDSRNDIIVRGNAPTGVLWQLEGLPIPNPNHYGSLNSTGGPVSLLNSNTLGPSDFLTGAFPAPYGNVLSSVFDLQLKNGNADHTEWVTQVSFTGFELGVEGPLSRHKAASYIVNYRYSTVGLLSSLGLPLGTGKATPRYQDLTAKVVFPVGSHSKLSLYGVGGPSQISFWGKDVEAATGNFYSASHENLITRYFTGTAGATLEHSLSRHTSGKLRLGFSRTIEKIEHDSLSPTTLLAFRDAEHSYRTGRVTLSYVLSHKFNTKNSFVAGTTNSLLAFRLWDVRMRGGSPSKINLDQNHSMALLQAFSQWKHRFSEALSLDAGFHVQGLSLTGTAVVEPRLGLRFLTKKKHTLALGYGRYALMQSPLLYFYQTPTSEGVLLTNKKVGFTQSQQWVGSYDYGLTSYLHLKTELYYQALTRVPVERRSSAFSLLNQGADFSNVQTDSLVNAGSGRNYGAEWTFEHFPTKAGYFLLTASWFSSTYKGSDGRRRNTAFNTHYALTIQGGKDFQVGKKNTVSAAIKMANVGGRYLSPIDSVASQSSASTIYDDAKNPYSLQQAPYFRMDLKLGYRKNNATSTLEFGLDVENVTFHKNIFKLTYNRDTQTVLPQYQQGFLPVPYFRFTF